MIKTKTVTKIDKKVTQLSLKNKLQFLKQSSLRTKLLIGLAILALLLLIFFNKQWLVSAIVNSSPITSLELLDRLSSQYRQQTLNQLINEKIIFQEAMKKKVLVSKKEIDNKILELEEKVGGKAALDALLIQQGQNRELLKRQLQLQLTAARLYESEATVSAQEVEEFISQNKSFLQATSSAEQTKEAEDALKQQKLSQIFNEKFQELKQKAKIQVF